MYRSKNMIVFIKSITNNRNRGNLKKLGPDFPQKSDILFDEQNLLGGKKILKKNILNSNTYHLYLTFGLHFSREKSAYFRVNFHLEKLLILTKKITTKLLLK